MEKNGKFRQYLTTIEGLKGKPAYLLCFAICALFSTSGIAFTIKGMMSENILFVILSFLSFVIAAILTFKIVIIVEKAGTVEKIIENASEDNANNKVYFKYYENQKLAEADIINELTASEEISIFTMRGHSYILPERAFGFLPTMKTKKIKYCVANPGAQSDSNRHVVKRANEYENTTLQSYWNDLKNDILKVEKIVKENPLFQCKFHEQPAILRFIILKNSVYFSFFKPYVSGSKLSIYRVDASSDIYSGFKRYFDYIWDESVSIDIIAR